MSSVIGVPKTTDDMVMIVSITRPLFLRYLLSLRKCLQIVSIVFHQYQKKGTEQSTPVNWPAGATSPAFGAESALARVVSGLITSVVHCLPSHTYFFLQGRFKEVFEEVNSYNEYHQSG